MDMIKQKWKKNLISKTWERCKSLGYSSSNKSSAGNSLTRSKTWHCTTKSSSSSPEKERPNNKCHQVAPEGCFTVYVGPQKERFVVNTKFANHPLFKMLLEDAELEYGYDTQGPILLPCKVDLFYKVLAAMESEDDDDDDDIDHHHPKGYSPLILCSPARRPSHRSSKAYRLFSPSRLLKLNGF